MRVLLELAGSDTTGVRYRAEIHAPAASWSSEATIPFDPLGAVTVVSWVVTRGEGDPEPWARDFVRALLRTLQKNHAADRSFPRRLLRWRDRGRA